MSDELDIFRLTVTDEELNEEFAIDGLPIGYIVAADGEVKARNLVRRYILGGSDTPEGRAYMKSAKKTSAELIGTTNGSVPAAVLAPLYAD